MYTRVIPFLLLSFGASSSASQTNGSQPTSERLANYTISVALDSKAKTLTGQETLVWKNASSDMISELQFHLYLNAFKNSESTYMRESNGFLRGNSQPENSWGWIDVTSMKTSDGNDLTPRIEFIHPDDDNEQDRTVFRVPLTSPVRPRTTITLSITFTAKLPRVSARTGYADDFFMVGQWFPKIGVYQWRSGGGTRTSGWNCHQFHANTEFFADFGVYDVDVTVPRKFVVGATGVLQRVVQPSDTTATFLYHAEDVHDFAWTASPRYVEVNDRWNHVALRLLVQPEHAQFATRYLSSARKTLEYFAAHVGPFAYPSMTIVDPPLKAIGAGGMEYPMLITGSSIWGIGEQIRLVEQVTIHELGHNYWYGMVANNEFEEAWLDEGINTYYECRIMDDAYGKHSSFVDFLGFTAGNGEDARSTFLGMRNPTIAPIATKAWQFTYGGYGGITYYKTATYLMTLERMIGTSVMDSVMQTYFRRWRFRHPTGRDFVAAFNDVVPALCGDRFGNNLDWFFDQMLNGTGICDYELTSLQVNQERKRDGIFTSKGTLTTAQDTSKSSGHTEYTSTITVSRLGDVEMPVDVLIRFSNGEEVRRYWDGQERATSFAFTRPERAVYAEVDPDHLLAIDANWLNNSRTMSPPRSVIWKYTAKMLFWIQNLLQTFAILG